MDGTPESLQAYVPDLVASWDVEAPGALRREVTGTLVLADVSGFTALSERLARLGRKGAEELTDIIDRLFSTLIGSAHDHGGQLLSFGGDALLLLFTGDNHAHRAGVVAHVIRSQVRSAGDQRTGVGRVRLRVSIGLNSGNLQTMLVGENHRMLVLAGTTASRTVAAEQEARAGEIVVSESTAELLPAGLLGRRDGVLLLRRPPSFTPSPARAQHSGSGSVELALPPAVRTHLTSSFDLLEHRLAAVGFIRIEDLDRCMEDEAEVAAHLIAEAVEKVQVACARFDVCVLTTDIDRDAFKIVLTSGVPNSIGDHAERMLLAARAIVDAGLPLPARIGITFGPVFAGIVGSAHRRTYTIMGDTVNLAARVMVSTPPGHVRATANVLDHTRAPFTTTPVEPFRVKGKSDLVHAVDIGRPKGDDGGPERPSEGDVFGRGPELEVLMGAWRAATIQGKAQFVELVGEPGIGKTTIVQHFSQAADGSRHIRLRGDLHTRTTPYRGLASLLSIAGDLSPGPEANAALTRLGERLTSELRQRLPLLNDVLGTTLPPTQASVALSDNARRRAVAVLVTELLMELLPDPTLFELEDTHWFDDATSEWLQSVSVAPPPAPWCFVGTRRPVPTGFRLAPGYGTSIPIEPLSEEAAAALIVAERGDRATPPELVRRLSRRAAGNPLYLRELVRALRGHEDPDELPDSLEALLTVRLDQLNPGDRHLVCRASVLGFRFDPELLRSVLDTSVADPDTAALGRVKDFVGPAPGGRLGFSHALIRDAAYQLLPFRLRRDLHARVAAHLSQTAEADASVLSFHYLAAQEWPQAWSSARRAADAALASHTPVEAAELLSRALTAGRRVPGLSPSTLMSTGLELSRAYERGGQFEAAEHNYRGLARLPVGAVDRARLKVQLAWLAERRSNLPLVVRRARSAIRLLDDAGAVGRDRDLCHAEARTVEGMAMEVMGRHREAADALEEAVRIARRIGADRTEAQAASILDWSLAMIGQLDEPTNLQRAIDLYRSVQDVPGEAACLTNLGALAYLSGEWTTAVDYYRRGQEAHARSGDETSAALGAANTAEVLSDQGHWAEAQLLLDEALAVWRSTGHEHGVAYAMGLLGRTQCRGGYYETGLTLLQDARERHQKLGAKDDAGQVWVWLAEGHMLAADPELSLSTLDAGADDGSVTARRVRATVLSLMDRQLGVAALLKVSEAATVNDEHYERVVLSHTLAVLDPASATQHLSSSRELADRLGVVRVAVPRTLI